jgi:GWxTD domain-containing protein
MSEKTMKLDACNRIILLSVLMAALSFTMECCSARGRIELDPESKDFYEYARLIMTKQEKDIFHLLADKESRMEFIQDFWAKRDPDPSTDENEFEEAFYRRIEFANKHFIEGIPGWKTDRGRIYIYLGPPDKVDQRPFINDPNVKGLIWWSYYTHQLGLEFVDRTGDGRYALGRQVGASGGLLDVLERAKFGQVFRDEGDFGRVFSDFEVGYERGKREIHVSIPVESLSFVSEEKMLKAEFDFEFFIYERKGLKKDRIKRQKTYEISEEEALQMDSIVLTFPYDLEPGEYYFDVVVIVQPKIGKVRKIFKIKG